MIAVFGVITGLYSARSQVRPEVSEVSPPPPPPRPQVPAEGRVTVIRGASNAQPVPIRVAPSSPSEVGTASRVVRPSPRTNLNLRQPAPARLPQPSAGSVSDVRARQQPTSLSFDEREKTVHLKSGEDKAEFRWAVTNTSAAEVTVLTIFTSCGCTAAQLPTHPNPWILKPGEGGYVGATMDVAGKIGTVAKTVTVVTAEGSYPLLARSVLPPEASLAVQGMMNRSRNLQVAAADRQAVFRGDCATCHVHPTIGKQGRELYETACGICHEAEHRASMVTYLRDREGDYNREYWEHWIRNGKEGSLMPAFEASRGGPLNDDQVKSLVEYLVKDYPLEPTPQAAAGHGTP